MATKKKSATKSRRKGGGGKLSRSEVVSVRLDPKLRYAAELAAKKHRRTLSSYIEWCVEESLDKVQVGLKEETAEQIMVDTWDQNEALRFIHLAIKYPYLLSYDEEKLWSEIFYWRYYWAVPLSEPDVEWDTTQNMKWVNKNFGEFRELKKNYQKIDFRKIERLFPILKQYLNNEITKQEWGQKLKALGFKDFGKYEAMDSHKLGKY